MRALSFFPCGYPGYTESRFEAAGLDLAQINLEYGKHQKSLLH